MNTGFVALNTEKITRHLWIYFFSVVIVNLAVKLIYLNYSSFWYDEIISLRSANEDFGHIKHVAEWDKNPPFYYYCLSVWVKAANNYSEFWVRSLSVIFSSLAGGMLLLVANRLFNKTTAFVASCLYLSSNLLYFYSHEARAYSLVVLLALLSCWLFFKLKEEPKIMTFLFLGLVNFLLIYTHYITGLIIAIQFILMLFFFSKKNKLYFSYGIIVTIAFILLRFTKKQFLLIVSFNDPNSTFWLQAPDLHYLHEVLASFLYSNIVMVICIIIMAVTLIIVFKQKNNTYRFAALYCFLVGFISIVGLYALGKITPVFLDRYLIFTIPFMLLLVAFGMSFIKHKWIAPLISLVFLMFMLFNINYKTPKPMDYRAAVNFLKGVRKNGDLVIVKTSDIKPLFCYYYDQQKFISKQENELIAQDIIFCTSWEDAQTVNLKDYNRIIVMDSFDDLNSKENDFKMHLSGIKKHSSQTDFYKGVRISFYR